MKSPQFTDDEGPGQGRSAPPKESEPANRDLERGVWLYWVALRYRLIEPDPASVLYARTEMAALVAGKKPSFLREILELVADQFVAGQKRDGRYIDPSSARLAALRDGCVSFPTIDWVADIFPVLGHA